MYTVHFYQSILHTINYFSQSQDLTKLLFPTWIFAPFQQNPLIDYKNKIYKLTRITCFIVYFTLVKAILAASILPTVKNLRITAFVCQRASARCCGYITTHSNADIFSKSSSVVLLVSSICNWSARSSLNLKQNYHFVVCWIKL